MHWSHFILSIVISGCRVRDTRCTAVQAVPPLTRASGTAADGRPFDRGAPSPALKCTTDRTLCRVFRRHQWAIVVRAAGGGWVEGLTRHQRWINTTR
jgi:hypothetical protein